MGVEPQEEQQARDVAVRPLSASLDGRSSEFFLKMPLEM